MRVDNLLTIKPFYSNLQTVREKNLINARLQITIQTPPQRHIADRKFKNNKVRLSIQQKSRNNFQNHVIMFAKKR